MHHPRKLLLPFNISKQRLFVSLLFVLLSFFFFFFFFFFLDNKQLLYGSKFPSEVDAGARYAHQLRIPSPPVGCETASAIAITCRFPELHDQRFWNTSSLL